MICNDCDANVLVLPNPRYQIQYQVSYHESAIQPCQVYARCKPRSEHHPNSMKITRSEVMDSPPESNKNPLVQRRITVQFQFQTKHVVITPFQERCVLQSSSQVLSCQKSKFRGPPVRGGNIKTVEEKSNGESGKRVAMWKTAQTRTMRVTVLGQHMWSCPRKYVQNRKRKLVAKSV